MEESHPRSRRKSNTSIQFVFPVNNRGRTILWLAAALIPVVWIGNAILSRFDMLNNFPTLMLYVFVLPAGFVYAVLGGLWFSIGKESLIVDGKRVILLHQIAGLRAQRTFTAEQVRAIYLSRYKNPLFIDYCQRSVPFYCFRNGMISIDVGKAWFGGARTFRCGISIQQEEARIAVATILRNFPQYRDEQKREQLALRR